ncbi:cupin domain-containing protein [Pseudonocardia endophytica]|uniref:Quercetin dioxygenase-like cupin family protein n=1 Tax=Pseudonocardia endophytica TaxID=401976 RepID=A0A4R1HKZ8_PSEEN|nr:cupin domain-containing protein [Pseudonocardia endophytica]TCK22628.1 quercetin dioxygenase-like cupin family protein [Pseudonocardia endophytica]
MDTTVITNATADAFAMPNTRAVPVATGADTGDGWEALELTLQPGAASPPHTLSADKVFYLADGVLEVEVDGATHTLGAGDVARIPAGIVHRYRNASDASARLLVLVTGATQVSFLRGMGRLGQAGQPEPGAVAEHAAAHGVRIMTPAG